jgi:hypothetical protein
VFEPSSFQSFGETDFLPDASCWVDGLSVSGVSMWAQPLEDRVLKSGLVLPQDMKLYLSCQSHVKRPIVFFETGA